jgi:adenylate kinase family enzyme
MSVGDRIVVIGSPGSGKSTFSKELAKIRGIPLYHLDKIYWKAGWNPVSTLEFEEELKKILVQKSWIIDGNYSQTLVIRKGYADTIFFMDLQWPICMFRVIKRNIKNRNRIRDDITSGCDEKFDSDFLILLKYIFHFPGKNRNDILRELSGNAYNKKITVFRTGRSSREFLKKLNKRDGKNELHSKF